MNSHLQIRIKNIVHRGEKRISVKFPYDKQLISSIRRIEGRLFSKTLKCWHVPDTKTSESHLVGLGWLPSDPNYLWTQEDSLVAVGKLSVNRNTTTATNKSYSIKPKKKPVREYKNKISSFWMTRLIEFKQYLEQNRYSDNSISSYEKVLKLFLAWWGDRPSEEMTLEELRRFNHEYFILKKHSRSYQNIWINAIRLFLQKHTEIEINLSDIERPRRSSFLPTVLSVAEVKRLILSYKNLKHKTIIMTFYACGLRKSELLDLKITDIDFDRRVLHIRNSKGAKDRDIALPEMLVNLVQFYMVRYKPKEYLFNGRNKLQYGATSIDKILANGIKRSGIRKKITPHGLRHSYATHLVEQNINLRYVQDALGHKSSRTTEIYTRLSKENIANMVSPIDFWTDITLNPDAYKGKDNIS